MAKMEKALKRLSSKPSDFEWNELKAIMQHLGFELKTTGGSGRKFIHSETRATYFIHEPHPSGILKAYQIRDAVAFLTKEGYIR
jgi:predicted RNA binding protein YcfA (HicA-like mRNA interferase family)